VTAANRESPWRMAHVWPGLRSAVCLVEVMSALALRARGLPLDRARFP